MLLPLIVTVPLDEPERVVVMFAVEFAGENADIAPVVVLAAAARLLITKLPWAN